MSSDRVVVICRSIGQRFINGISNGYDDTYPRELEGVIDETDFVNTMRSLNETIMNYWPCSTCYLFGYVFAPCTLGLSLCLPATCINQSEAHAMRYVEQVSLRARCFDKGIEWKLKKTCCDSHIEISFPESVRSKSSDTGSQV